jgi:predicted permease
MTAIAFLESAARDARFAVRVLRKAPVFTIAASLTLALAIAVNAAMFSVVDGVLLKPLPYPDADRLALVTVISRGEGESDENTSVDGATWQMIRDHASTIDRAVCSMWPTGANVVAGGTATYVQRQRVGSGFFGVLGVRPFIGREFNADEDRAGGPAATVLSHGLWRAMFNGDPGVVGRTLMLRGEASTVVGVMPEGFQTGVRADLWTPLRASTTGEGEGENYAVVARVRAGTEWTRADAEMRQIGAEILRRRPLPAGFSRWFSLQPLQRGLTAPLRRPLLLLWAAVGVVMLIASVNLAGLMLARASVRTREIATRMALGSGRAAVIRQMLVESLVLALAGGAAGVALGVAALEALKSLAANAFEIWQPVSLDLRAAAAAGGLSIVASAVFGIAPALHATRLDMHTALMQAGARTVAGSSRRWPRRVLVVAQVALGVVLLVGAGLLVRTFSHLRHLAPGFDATGVITASVSLDDARYRTASRVAQMFDATLAGIRESPGVEAAGVSLGLPYQRILNLGFRHLDGPQAAAPRGRMTNATYVAGDVFQALRIPLRAGRLFDHRDRADSQGVVIVNEAFAREYFDGGNPVGRRIAFAGRERDIIGVVGNVQVRPGWGDNGPIAAMPLAYVPLVQAPDGLVRLVHGWFSPAIIVRAARSNASTVSALRRALDAADPLLPFADVRSMREVQQASLAQQRFLMVLLAALATAAVLLAAVGIHGLIATTVTERTREMGIRLALGATLAQAARSLALPGVFLALIGIGIGAVAAVGFGRLLRHFLWGVSANDPLTFAVVSGLLLCVASLASVVPALRIVRLDPAKTLNTNH